VKKITVSIIGCGWMGLPTAIFLLKNGFIVKGSTTTSEKIPILKKEGVIPYLIKLPEDDCNIEDFLKCEILIINIPIKRRPYVEGHHINQVKNILDKMAKHPRIIYVSSTTVYDETNSRVLETDKLIPKSKIGMELLQVEQILSKHFDTTILRVAGLAGYDRHPGLFFAGRKDIPKYNAPTNIVHLDDCVQVIYQVIRQSKWGAIYNVCSDEHPTKEEFYTSQASKLGLAPPSFLKENDLTYKIVSNEKIKHDLGYQFIHPDPMAM
jgi:nucleoside-diphosphate-sugar epimerase